jgi:hypothetical protein
VCFLHKIQGKVFHGIDKNVFHNIAVEIKIGVEAEDAHKLCSVRIFGCGFSNNVLIVTPINGLNTHNCIAFAVCFCYLRYFYTAKLHILFGLAKFSCVIFTQIPIFNILLQENGADNR